MIHFQKASFVTSAFGKDGYPKFVHSSGLSWEEVAVCGRSNVGKSSLLNHLFQMKKLVKTSSTPGKTQSINFFTIDDQLAFADLPGYGFAKVPKKVRASWGPMIQDYLDARESLRLILFLFDIRRKPNEEDLQLLEWIVQSDKPMILVLTKVDKVNQADKKRFTERILKGFDAQNLHYVHYSVLKNVGRKILIHKMLDALQIERGGSHESA